MKVFMTGGTGFVGSYLSRELVQQGHEVTILTRREKFPAPAAAGIGFITGDPTQEGPWMGAVPEHDWIINLAGASIFSRWSAGYKREIYDSRIRTTRNLVIALAEGDRRQLLCSTSAVGYYGPRGDEVLTEDSPPDSYFLAHLAEDWEAEALKAAELGIRVVITRFGIVLGQGGGALGQMAPMFRRFLGGPLGSGQAVVFLDSPGGPGPGLQFRPGAPRNPRPGELHHAPPGAQLGTDQGPGKGAAPAHHNAGAGVHDAPGPGGICRRPAHRPASHSQKVDRRRVQI